MLGPGSFLQALFLNCSSCRLHPLPTRSLGRASKGPKGARQEGRVVMSKVRAAFGGAAQEPWPDIGLAAAEDVWCPVVFVYFVVAAAASHVKPVDTAPP